MSRILKGAAKATYPRFNPKVTGAQLSQIHIACKELGISDDDRHAMLMERFKKTSSRDLSRIQADRLISEFKQRGWKKKAGKVKPVNGKHAYGKQRFESLGHRPGMASPKQLRLIEVLWRKVSFAGDDTAQDKALREFLWARFGIETLEFLTLEVAGKVIVAVKEMNVRQS